MLVHGGFLSPSAADVEDRFDELLCSSMGRLSTHRSGASIGSSPIRYHDDMAYVTSPQLIVPVISTASSAVAPGIAFLSAFWIIRDWKEFSPESSNLSTLYG